MSSGLCLKQKKGQAKQGENAQGGEGRRVTLKSVGFPKELKQKGKTETAEIG